MTTDRREYARRWREENRARVREYNRARRQTTAPAVRVSNETRAVLRRNGTNVFARCEWCADWVKMTGGPVVVVNVFERGLWQATLHYHVECYREDLYGPVTRPPRRTFARSAEVMP